MRALTALVLLLATLPGPPPQSPAPAQPSPAPDPAVAAFVAAATDQDLEDVMARYPKLGADQASRLALAAEGTRLTRSADFKGADRLYRSMWWLGVRIQEPRLKTTALIGRATAAGQTGDLFGAQAFLF